MAAHGDWLIDTGWHGQISVFIHFYRRLCALSLMNALSLIPIPRALSPRCIHSTRHRKKVQYWLFGGFSVFSTPNLAEKTGAEVRPPASGLQMAAIFDPDMESDLLTWNKLFWTELRLNKGKCWWTKSMMMENAWQHHNRSYVVKSEKWLYRSYHGLYSKHCPTHARTHLPYLSVGACLCWSLFLSATSKCKQPSPFVPQCSFSCSEFPAPAGGQAKCPWRGNYIVCELSCIIGLLAQHLQYPWRRCDTDELRTPKADQQW